MRLRNGAGLPKWRRVTDNRCIRCPHRLTTGDLSTYPHTLCSTCRQDIITDILRRHALMTFFVEALDGLRRQRDPMVDAKWSPKDYKDEGRKLEWGKDISPENMALLRCGQIFTLHDKDGQPFSKVLMNSYNEICERML